MEMRFPRAVLAFLTGAALSASGTVMQSILKNPLASSYTLGVSSGASLCAALVMVTGVTFPLLGSLFTLPAAGFAGGLATVFLALGFCRPAGRQDGKSDGHPGGYGVLSLCQRHSDADHRPVPGAPAADGLLADGRLHRPELVPCGSDVPGSGHLHAGIAAALLRRWIS